MNHAYEQTKLKKLCYPRRAREIETLMGLSIAFHDPYSELGDYVPWLN